MAPERDLPGLGPSGARPRLRAELNAAAHVQSPEEYFVLSRVDGHTSYEELCLISGLGFDPTLALLRRFKEAGLIFNPGEPEPTPPPPVPASPPRRTTASRAAVTPLLERLDDGSPVDTASLGPAPGLSAATQERILRLHRRLKALTPHDLLGVPPGAEFAEVKRAYFAASKELHPDRYFGRDLGAYHALLSEIFAKLSAAFDTLRAETGKK